MSQAYHSVIDEIKKCLEVDYQATHSDQTHFFRYAKSNLHELRVALEKSCDAAEWSQIKILGGKIEALAVNLKWDELRQAGVLFVQMSEKQDVETTRRLLSKLDTILGAIVD